MKLVIVIFAVILVCELSYVRCEEIKRLRVGCYRNKSGRELGNTKLNFGGANSQDFCIATCKEKSYRYAAPQNGNLCFCGNKEPSEKIEDVNCNKICRGKATETCGGYGALEVFETGHVLGARGVGK